MHHRYVFLLLATLLTAGTHAQELAGTGPTNRTALLEEFTAINCGNCPAAHAVANTLSIAHPNELVLIGVHGGALANPSTGQLDLRTTDGAALWIQEGVMSQPKGTVNRGPLQAVAQWSAAIQDILAQPSPVNLGMVTSFNTATRELTVDVELYYTADGTGGPDRISVALTQDHIIGYQQDYVNGAHPDYDHRHVLRDHITPLTGDEVATTALGSVVPRTWTYTVPENWAIVDLSVVAFVGEENGPVYQVRSVPAAGGTTMGMAPVRDFGTGMAFPVPAKDLVIIPVEANVEGLLVLRDALGRIVRQERVAMGAQRIVFSVSDLGAGTYFYALEGRTARRLVVVH